MVEPNTNTCVKMVVVNVGRMKEKGHFYVENTQVKGRKPRSSRIWRKIEKVYPLADLLSSFHRPSGCKVPLEYLPGVNKRKSFFFYFFTVKCTRLFEGLSVFDISRIFVVVSLLSRCSLLKVKMSVRKKDPFIYT